MDDRAAPSIKHPIQHGWQLRKLHYWSSLCSLQVIKNLFSTQQLFTSSTTLLRVLVPHVCYMGLPNLVCLLSFMNLLGLPPPGYSISLQETATWHPPIWDAELFSWLTQDNYFVSHFGLTFPCPWFRKITSPRDSYIQSRGEWGQTWNTRFCH